MKNRSLIQLFLGILIAFNFSSAMAMENEFAVRAIHVDMRTQVMTMEALKDLADKAAANGLNALVMEWEASFPFKENFVLRSPEAYSEEEVKDFIAYCEGLGLDVIPLQNCFGHCEYILKHERYASLREDNLVFSQVCPLKIEECKTVFKSIFRDIVSLHRSPYVHIGADETRLLGKCRACSEFLREHNKSELFVNYVRTMCEIVEELGKTPVIWADMILKYPEHLKDLPENLIIVDWNYGWEPKYFGDIDQLIQSGVKMWGASALRCSPDNIYQIDWQKHFSNLTTFVPYAREHGYQGMIQTSWSTSGQYGYLWDWPWDIIDMQPVREVYPMKAFDILIDAFGYALRSPEAFDPASFITSYCQEKYGLDAKGCEVMVEYFSEPQKMVNVLNSKRKAVLDYEIERCQYLLDKLSKVKVRKNKKEFRQYVLMLEIRNNYLGYQHLEYAMENNPDVYSQRAHYYELAQKLLEDAYRCRKVFNRTHRNYLKKPERCLGEWSYIAELERIEEKFRTL